MLQIYGLTEIIRSKVAKISPTLGKVLFPTLGGILLAGCVAAPMRLPTHTVDASGGKTGKLDFSFLKADVTTRKELDEKLKPLDSGFQDTQLFWGRFVESNWGVGAVVADPGMPAPVVGGGRVWHARNLMIELDPNGVVKRWEILDDQHLEAYLQRWIGQNKLSAGDIASGRAYPMYSCYCGNSSKNDGSVTFSEGTMQLREAKDSPGTITLAPAQIRKIIFNAPISPKDNSPDPSYFYMQVHLKEKVQKRKVLYLKIQATTLYEFLRFQTSAAS